MYTDFVYKNFFFRKLISDIRDPCGLHNIFTYKTRSGKTRATPNLLYESFLIHIWMRTNTSEQKLFDATLRHPATIRCRKLARTTFSVTLEFVSVELVYLIICSSALCILTENLCVCRGTGCIAQAQSPPASLPPTAPAENPRPKKMHAL